jgi:thiazole synthase ThiGH ThiG subunit
MSDTLTIAGRTFQSRLIVGTGKYRSFQEMARCHEATGADMVTVAVRRVNLTDRSKESLLDYIDRSKIFILPNTAGCYTADDAIRTARLAREVGSPTGSSWRSSATKRRSSRITRAAGSHPRAGEGRLRGAALHQ